MTPGYKPAQTSSQGQSEERRPGEKKGGTGDTSPGQNGKKISVGTPPGVPRTRKRRGKKKFHDASALPVKTAGAKPKGFKIGGCETLGPIKQVRER